MATRSGPTTSINLYSEQASLVTLVSRFPKLHGGLNFGENGANQWASADQSKSFHTQQESKKIGPPHNSYGTDAFMVDMIFDKKLRHRYIYS